MRKRRGSGRRRQGSEDSSRDRPKLVRRPPRWSLVVGIILCAAAAGLFLLRPFWRTDERGRDGGPRQDKEEQRDEDLPPLAPAYSFTEPAQATIDDLTEEATRVAVHLVESYPNSPDAHDLTARVHYRFGNSAEAVRRWQRCLELDPRLISAYNGMGLAAVENQQYEEAAALLRKALEIDPASNEASTHLANALMNLGKMEEVVAVLEEAVEYNRRSMPSFVLLGQAYLQLKQYQKAKQSFQAAAQIAPDSPNACYGLARACARLGEQAEAREYRQRYKKLGAEDLKQRIDRGKGFDDLLSVRQSVAQSHTDAGRLHARHGNMRIAERLWQRAAALEPKGTLCRIELAALYERNGQDPEALEICEQLREIDPENGDYWLNVGLLNARLNRFDAALSAMERAVQLDPRNPRYRQAYEVIRKGK
jgi:tetratricopeptide (TPR) repeat protein